MPKRIFCYTIYKGLLLYSKKIEFEYKEVGKMYQGIAAAKVNLTLDVKGRRPDGYHFLESVMQTLSLCDIVEVEPAARTTLSCDMPELSCAEDNLAWRAWALLQKEYNLDAGVKITLHKQIPLGGGLAGGSSNAAQVLLAVNEIFALKLPPAKLIELAAQLGADVPFCLQGGTALACGIGEELQPQSPCPELRLVLVNPGFAVNTASVYAQYDLNNNAPEDRVGGKYSASTQSMLKALQYGDPAQIRENLFNVLEPPAFQLFPPLAALKQELTALGLSALLCGSGATVMGIAADKKRAAIAADKLQGKYPFVRAVTSQNF